MEQQTTAQKQMSLRAKATGWLAAILLVTLISIGIATAVGQWTVKAFDTLLEDNAACYAVQDAIKEETRAFEHYVREPSQESSQTFADACPSTTPRSARTAMPAPGACGRAMRATRRRGTPSCSWPPRRKTMWSGCTP
mgnify:CR=1 FL=1